MPTKSKSPITTKGAVGKPLVERRLPTHRPPTHPGEMLLEEFLKPLGITLARVTGMSADFWLGLQQDWDLWHALRSEKAEEIARLRPLKQVG